ncbi:MAG: haloacid dehalogenase, type [Marmoricola sp.]|nr:haloacid dehalogenase, type [Marmoricola sp.]
MDQQQSSPTPTHAPAVVVFDVNETLSDLSPLAARFVAVGQPASACSLWFASVLRDAFALSVAGQRPTFAEVARETMLHQFSRTELHRPLEESVDHVLAGLRELPVHADVVSGVAQLHDAGFRLVTLSNGSTSIAEKLLTDAGVRDRFERVLSVEEAGVWKPGAGSYAWAAEQCGVEVSDMVLVAVHPWDVDGAARAGLRTAWVDRSEAHYPATFTAPTWTVAGIDALTDALRGS